MKRIIFLVFALCFAFPAYAQNVTVHVVGTCGGESLPTTSPAWLRMDTTGTLCTAGGSGGTSYTVNYGSAIGTKGTPGGFKDGSGNFQSFTGSVANGLSVDCGASNNTLCGLIGGPVPAGTNIIGSTSNDPCASQLKLNVPIGTSSGNLQLVPGVASKKVYICSLFVVGAAAFVGNIIEGTGAACTTANELAVIGSTTAASGVSLAANNGWVLGNGLGTVGVTATAANGICLLQPGTIALAGNITYVQQ